MEKIAVEEMDVECEVEVASTSDRSWLFNRTSVSFAVGTNGRKKRN